MVGVVNELDEGDFREVRVGETVRELGCDWECEVAREKGGVRLEED